ncbi:coenzyme F420-0:L-glutamate ligase [Sphingobium aquiterrae]|uniref:coenzyme F420-0:L-glutamate ligase n=1 Tax=Sphingobium aquiterrae TaxID=2038656 RepID=UPI003016355A
MNALSIIALHGIPIVRTGDDLPAMLLDSLAASALELTTGDVIVLAQKIVSKAEGQMVALADVTPSSNARALAAESGKDPRLVELILSEAESVVRVRPNLIIVRHRLGFVLANAGIDHSNVALDQDQVLLLPLDPDGSARRIREALSMSTGQRIAVLVIDSIGRAWRNGTIGTAIGISGMAGLLDLRGRLDLNGRPLQSSELGYADEVAAAASLVMGQSDEGVPAVLIRGLAPVAMNGSAADLIRPPALDLFG